MAKTQTSRSSRKNSGSHKGSQQAAVETLEPGQSSDAQLDAETQNRYEQAKKSDLTIRDLQKMSIDELHNLAKEEGLDNYTGLKRQELNFQILKARIAKQGLMYGEGVLEVLPDGFGFFA